MCVCDHSNRSAILIRFTICLTVACDRGLFVLREYMISYVFSNRNLLCISIRQYIDAVVEYCIEIAK